MATTTTERASGNGKVRTNGTSRLRTARSIRRGEVIAGVLLVIVGGLLVKALVDQAGDRRSVVVVRHDVAEGAVLQASDLATARVAIDSPCSGSGDRACVSAVAGDRLDELVGRTASVPLRKGTLLASSHVAQAGAPRPDEVITAIPVSRERLPTGIEVGDRVRLIDTEGGGGPESVLIASARVFAVHEPERLSGTVVVSVIIPAASAPSIASAIASDRVGLVLLTTR